MDVMSVIGEQTVRIRVLEQECQRLTALNKQVTKERDDSREQVAALNVELAKQGSESSELERKPNLASVKGA